MKLILDDQTVDSPGTADIERAVPSTPPAPGWSLRLARSVAHAIEADATTEGLYHIAVIDNGDLSDGAPDVDATTLRELLALYAGNKPEWRARLTWSRYNPAAQQSTPAWMIALLPVGFVAAGIGFPVLVGMLGRVHLSQVPLPAELESSQSIVIGLFFLACVALFLVALLSKLYETRRASIWPSASGRIVRSRARLDLVRASESEIPRNERTADIVYEYKVQGHTHRGSRVSLAERTRPDEIPALLTRYPQGKIVPVYYNPQNPAEAILDRSMPQSAMLGCTTLLAVAIAAVIAIMYIATNGPVLIKAVFPHAVPALVFLFGFPGLFILAIAMTLHRGNRAARNWPVAMATITRSEVHNFELIRDSQGGAAAIAPRIRTAYMPLVEYAYKVAGRDYAGRTLRLDSDIAGTQDYARRLASKYPIGTVVKVRYDPADPSRSVLELNFGVVWLLLAVALACLLLAVWATGALTGAPVVKLH